MTRKFTF